MIRRHLAIAAVALVAATPLATFAQGAGTIVGTWNIEWEMGRSIVNGEQTAIMATGTMKVEVSGDSLLATVTTAKRSDGQPITRPPFTIGGRRTDKGASFTQISTATLNTNGEERTQRSIGTWMLEVQGDQLTGQVKREIEGLQVDIPPAAVKGSRAT